MKLPLLNGVAVITGAAGGIGGALASILAGRGCHLALADKEAEGLAAVAEKRLLEERLVRKGDVIGIVAGTPMGIRGTTNFMKFHVIGGAA